MASGGHVDRIAEEFGVKFIKATDSVKGRHQSKARRTCQKLLKNHGPKHLRLVLGLMNTKQNRGNWTVPVISAVSWLVLNKPAITERKDFLTLFDRLNLADLMISAKRVNPTAPTATLRVVLTYELERMVMEEGKEKAA